MKIKVSVEPTTIYVDPSTYQEAWEEYCQDTERVTLEEFVLAKVDEELQEGERQLNDVFESSVITTELVDE